jgi:hypothetical protein
VEAPSDQVGVVIVVGSGAIIAISALAYWLLRRKKPDL